MWIIVTILALLALVLIGLAILLLRFVYRLWRKPPPGRAMRRSIIVICAALIIAAPYYHEHQFLLARVPSPLKVAAIEYRLEKSWGLGFLPGDNETGFVVYRLTRKSAEWARQQGNQLGKMLPTSHWLPTPVTGDSWHHYDHDPSMMSATRAAKHPPTIAEYLEKYGFLIDIENGQDAEADQAIQSEGSIYAYGKGGSVTIVDPIRGKVYFAYAG